MELRVIDIVDAPWGRQAHKDGMPPLRSAVAAESRNESGSNAAGDARHDDDAPGSEPRVWPMQHAVWLASAAQHLGHRGNPRLPSLKATVAETGLTAFRHGFGPQRLVPIATRETGEPSDLPWLGEQDAARRAEQLAGQSWAIDMPRVPANSRSLVALRKAFAGRGFVITREAPGTPYIDLDPSWSEPESKFNAGRRSDFRRAQRHAEKVGALTFEIHERVEPAVLDRLLDEAYDVEARSWKGEGGTALACDPALGPFFRDYAHKAMDAGILRLAFMRIGGKAVGMQFGMEFDQRLWLCKIGYDPAYSKSSPGNLLMLYTLGEAAKRGLKSYEFLGSIAPWTEHWTTAIRPYVAVRFYPRSVMGFMTLGQDFMKAMTARFREKLAARKAAGKAAGPAAQEPRQGA